MKKTLIDLGERSLATFAQAFLAVLTAHEAGITEFDALRVAAIAGGYAVAKYLLVGANAYLRTAPPSK